MGKMMILRKKVSSRQSKFAHSKNKPGDNVYVGFDI